MDAVRQAPPATAVYDVNVLTRWHQLGTILGLVAIGPAIGGALFFYGMDHDWNSFVVIPLFLACMFLTPVLIFRSYRIADRVWVGADGLYFENRPAIPFHSLVAYNTDDYLKLTRQSGPTLLVQATRKSNKTYKQFLEAVASSAERWRLLAPQSTPGASLQRRYFYGSTAAKAIGAFLIVASIGITIGVLMLPRPPYGALGAAASGLFFGIALLTRKRPD